MSIEKISLVQIGGKRSALNQALVACCDSELFHIELPSNGITAMGLHPIQEQNPYLPLLDQCYALLSLFDLTQHYHEFDTYHLEEDETQIHGYLEALTLDAKKLEQQINALSQELEFHNQAMAQIEHLRGLDTTFDTFLHSARTTTRFGRLPIDSFPKLSYFTRQLFFFLDFDHDEEYYWGIYIAPTSEIHTIDRIFESLYFEAIDLPDFAHGTPEDAMRSVQHRIANLTKQLDGATKQLEELKTAEQDKLLAIYSYLKLHSETHAYRKYAVCTESNFFIEGFVPTKQLPAFMKELEPYPELVCEATAVESLPEYHPPTKLHTMKFFKPFEMFVSMYGLPDYYGINPTSFIGFLYVLIFGIMFGDLGQGLLLAVGGALVYRKNKLPLAAILSRCGISSCIFGTLYGSVFGFEEVLNPVFQLFGFADKPIHVFESETTMGLLITVLALGLLIIIVTICMNIVLKLRKKDYESALFSNNGIAGLVFYVGVVAAVTLLMVSEINLLNPIFILVVIVLPLACMFLREPLTEWVVKRKVEKPEGGMAGFIMQNFFEVFEMVLSYIANSLSFLRIGGFVLSHAGMMAVVMTLAEMAGTIGSIPVIIIGNLFVMGLEAFLVAIQVLRLTFYEIFSRFYEGDGKPFNPMKIHYDR